MPKPSEIITAAAALMNDAAQSLYTNTACLPYLNISLNILQEIFENNSLPVTEKTSATIIVPSGYSKIGFDTTPSLPMDLIEIKELWESPTGTDEWVPIIKHDFIPHYLDNNQTISQFLIWAWKGQAIELIAANTIVDLKLDYISSIFKTPILITNIDVNLPFTNILTYLEFETAALCAMFIAENETRAQALNSLAADALTRALGIPIKNMQSMIIRRRPFRASFKRRGISY